MNALSFRRLTDDDLSLLHRWLNDPAVVRWWEGDDVSWPAVVADYGSGRPDDGVEMYLAELDGEPVGWIQCYPARSSPEECEEWFPLGVDEAAAGIDYLIGDTASRGQGLGSRMIRAFVDDVVFPSHPDWTQAAASPYQANEASCGALVNAGFRFVGTFSDPDGPCALHVIDRPGVCDPA